MKLVFLAALLSFGSLASAATLSVDFTQSPTAFNIDLTWDSFSVAATTFTGTFASSDASTGTDTVAIVDENTGELLDLLDLNFTSNGNDGIPAEETFSVTVDAGIDSGTAPAGSTSVDATGAPVDITGLLPNLPGSLDLLVTENSPSAAAAATPEPASLTLIGLGLVAMSLVRRSAGKTKH